MPWIDTHVHLFTAAESAGEDVALYQPTGELNSVALYKDVLKETLPEGVVSVDFSKAKDPAHVINSLNDLKKAGIPAKGIIRGLPDNDTILDWITRDDIAGIRLYAVANCPDLSEHKAGWDRLFNQVRHLKKHIAVYGAGELLHGLIAQLPHDITLLIDHLGMPDATNGTNQNHFAKLLATLSTRHKTGAPVFIKGPGYRSGLSAKKVAPFIAAWIAALGEEQVMLGASDAPFVGFKDAMDYPVVLDYVDALIGYTAEWLQSDAKTLKEKLVYDNAKTLYGF